MKRYSKIFSIAFVFTLIFTSHAFAARETISLPENQVWISKSDTRSGSSSKVYSRLYAVYPTKGGSDNFTRVQVKVTSSTGVSMSNIITLYETSTSNTSISLKDGTLGNKKVKFQFRGNNPDHAAKADVSYDAR